MKRLKILYIVGHLSFPLRTGPLKDVAELLCYMSDKHECDVLGFTFDEEENIKTISRKIMENLPRINLLRLFNKNMRWQLRLKQCIALAFEKPLGFARWHNEEFRRSIAAAIKSTDYDLVHFFWFPAVGQYLPMCLNIPTVLTLQDSQSLICLEAGKEAPSAIKGYFCSEAARRYRKAERKLYPKATIVHTVSHEDEEYIKSFVPNVDIRHIPIHFPKECGEYKPGGVKKEPGPSLIMLRPYGKGLMWFLDEVYPRIMKRIPLLETKIIGNTLPTDALARIIADPRITYSDWEEDYYGEIVRHRAVVLTDTFGAGMANRALVSMALARPIVGTPKSFRGLAVKNGIDCIVESDPLRFADAVVRVVNSEEMAREMGERAKESVFCQYAHSNVMGRMDDLYEEVIYKFKRRRERAGHTGGHDE